MKPSTFVIGIFLVAILFVGMYEFASSIIDENAYNVEYDTKYQTAFDKTTSVSNQISDDYDTIVNSSVDKTLYLALVPEAVSLIKNMIKLPFTLVVEMTTTLIGYTQLPVWMESFIIAIMMALLVFAVIALILRYKYT